MPCPFGVSQYTIVDSNIDRGTRLAEAFGGGYVVARQTDIPAMVKLMIAPAPIIMVARGTPEEQLVALKDEFSDVIGYDPDSDPIQLAKDVARFREEYSEKRKRSNPVSMAIPDSIDAHLVNNEEPWIHN
ncbi:hypothetical protein J4209_02815 [Candidatus Woesearchaeota archaeon]|nr:hypothetical protein [Candidatus Woesearchaeota archaeon]